jgi:hypothetical protein
MQGKYKVITLCGSTKFKDEFLKIQKALTLDGNIVISVGLFGHAGDDEILDYGIKRMLDDMHKRKIDMADEIFVINVGGYIGSSTRSEIEYAKATNKPVRYLVDPDDGSMIVAIYTDRGVYYVDGIYDLQEACRHAAVYFLDHDMETSIFSVARLEKKNLAIIDKERLI